MNYSQFLLVFTCMYWESNRFSDVWPRYHFTCVFIIGNN